MSQTVVAMFENIQKANLAVRELVEMGFHRETISIFYKNKGTAQPEAGVKPELDTELTPDGSKAGAGVGAGIGAAIGIVGGLLIGLGALTIPGIGLFIAAGPIATALTAVAGAGVGAATGGFTGSLLGAMIGFGIPQEEAEYYVEGVQRGGIMVAVQVDEYTAENVQAILLKHEPLNIQQQGTQWRAEGWTGYMPG